MCVSLWCFTHGVNVCVCVCVHVCVARGKCGQCSVLPHGHFVDFSFQTRPLATTSSCLGKSAEREKEHSRTLTHNQNDNLYIHSI